MSTMYSIVLQCILLSLSLLCISYPLAERNAWIVSVGEGCRAPVPEVERTIVVLL